MSNIAVFEVENSVIARKGSPNKHAYGRVMVNLTKTNVLPNLSGSMSKRLIM